jgi:tRNA threonylcarbamoyladenosine biosynthesis protein TsaB
MSLILNFDTSTTVCSVALAENLEVLSYREDREGRNHAVLLTPFIEETLIEASRKPEELDAIAVSRGPGSYTGLRIGVSTAKGMAYALSKPLIAIDTLEAMFSAYMLSHPELAKVSKLLICPMIDARRMEVFSSFFEASNGNVFREVQADVIDSSSFSDIFADYKVIFIGDGAEKSHQVLLNSNAILDKNYSISAKDMVNLSYEKLLAKEIENTAYFEPFYLKDFIATTPKNNFF